MVLLITLGSLLAAGLPLLVAAAGLTVGLAAITAASGFADLNTDTSALALMLGIAVAIDYSLFIILRYRQLAATGYALPEAAGQAVGRAGSAVLFAGLTVVIALAGLTVVGIPALTQVGLAAAFTVAMAVIAALTLLPALLGWGGERLVRVRSLRRGTGPARMTMGRRWAATVVSHRLPVLLGATAILLLAAVPALDLRLGFPDDGTAPADTTQRKAYDLIADGFGPGANGPLTVVVDAGADAAAPPRPPGCARSSVVSTAWQPSRRRSSTPPAPPRCWQWYPDTARPIPPPRGHSRPSVTRRAAPRCRVMRG